MFGVPPRKDVAALRLEAPPTLVLRSSARHTVVEIEVVTRPEPG